MRVLIGAVFVYALMNNWSTGTILALVGIYLIVTWDDDDNDDYYPRNQAAGE